MRPAIVHALRRILKRNAVQISFATRGLLLDRTFGKITFWFEIWRKTVRLSEERWLTRLVAPIFLASRSRNWLHG
jgi:hypothetical protein